MALAFKVESLDGIDDGLKSLYVEHEGGYQLSVDGIEPTEDTSGLKNKNAQLLKEAKDAKEEARLLRETKAEAERAAALEKGEFEGLWKKSEQSAIEAQNALKELKEQIKSKDIDATASGLASLSADPKKVEALKHFALRYIQYSEDGIKLGDGEEEMTAEAVQAALAEQYPFLVDGSQASGGGAAGSQALGAENKKFSEYTGQELAAIRAENPAEYDRLKAQAN